MIWLISIIVLLALAYIALVAWDAKRSVQVAPKAEMFVCDIHGPLPLSGTHVLFDGAAMDYETTQGVKKREPIRYCAICFETRIKEARHGR